MVLRHNADQPAGYELARCHAFVLRRKEANPKIDTLARHKVKQLPAWPHLEPNLHPWSFTQQSGDNLGQQDCAKDRDGGNAERAEPGLPQILDCLPHGADMIKDAARLGK